MCGGTSSIHTDKTVTFLICLVRLLATKLASRHTWEKLIKLKDFAKSFASAIRWPKGARDSNSAFKEFITSSSFLERKGVYNLKYNKETEII